MFFLSIFVFWPYENDAVRSLHPQYGFPFVALQLIAQLSKYIEWLSAALRSTYGILLITISFVIRWVYRRWRVCLSVSVRQLWPSVRKRESMWKMQGISVNGYMQQVWRRWWWWRCCFCCWCFAFAKQEVAFMHSFLHIFYYNIQICFWRLLPLLAAAMHRLQACVSFFGSLCIRFLKSFFIVFVVVVAN